MKVTFEEKQYENQMNLELACQEGLYKNKSLFSPGQVFEGALGFDAAMHSCNKNLWKIFYKDWDYLFHKYMRYWRHGVDLSDLHDFSYVFEKIFNHMPNIKYNLFIQYKRAKYLEKSNSNEFWKWKTPYFRYKLQEKQQKLLEELSTKLGNNALVIYAAPAFTTQEEFWENVNNQTIIMNSNFCKVEELKGHHRYTYTRGGRWGIAFSEPEEIKAINLKQELSILRENLRDNENYNNGDFIINLSMQIESILLESQTDFSYFYKMRMEKVKESDLWRVDSKLYNSLTKINIFEEVTGIQVFNGY